MKKLETAKATFEYVFGQGFFEVIPVETFNGKKLDASYYQNMTIHINMTGFNAADLYHEAAHALDDLLFKTNLDLFMFMEPFFDELTSMEYFDGFLSQYPDDCKLSELFAESVAMGMEHPDWETGHALITAIRELLN